MRLRSLAARLASLVFPLAAGLASCADEPDQVIAPPGPGPVAPATSLAAGDFAVALVGQEIQLQHGGATLLRFPADAFQLGTVDAIDDSFNYDPYPLYVDSALFDPPDGLAWRNVTALTPVAASGALAFALTYEGGTTATLRFEMERAGSFKVLLKPEDPKQVAYFRLRPRATADEGFYGLGEYFDEVNQRGKIRSMQLELDTKLESSYNEAHVPVPFLIGTRGWGLFVESPYPGTFAVAQAAPDLIEAAFGTGAASGQGLTFHLFAALAPLDITRLYYEATAYPRLPAPWALGPWVWRDENKDQAQVEDDIAKIRSLDLATSALWIDRPYATAVQTFDFKKEQFPDPDGMIQKLHDYGLRTALWHAPYLDEKDPATQDAVAEARSKGYYPPEVGPLFNKWGTPIDLTNPDAYAWWQGKIRTYTARGVEGFKLDYGEDIVPGVGKIRTAWRFADGSDERTMHSRFSLLYHRVYAETLPAAGGFLLCRHSTYGDQANVSVIWPGDLDASFAHFRDPVTDGSDSYNAVGGLPASVVAGLSLGPSGFPFFGADTGGYRHSPPDKELFVRWFEQTALSSVMQIGTSSNTVAWEKEGGPGFDDELLSLYRDYTRLHLRLFPYEWTLAQDIARTGRPLQRPLGLAYPDLGQHPSDEYLFGPDLLVAPVIERGATTRPVIFPPGRWVDWFSGEVVAGGATQMVDAPLGKLPLYLRESGIVPLLRPTIDTLSPTTHPDEVDSYDTSPGVLFARIFPGPASILTLFDGSVISQSIADSLLSVSVKDGSAFSLGSRIELLGLASAPASLTLDGGPFDALASLAALDDGPGWFFDGSSLHLRIPPGEHTVKASLP